MSAPLLMSIKKASNEYGIPESLIRRLVNEGKIPGFHSGKRFYIQTAQFAEAVERICQEAAAKEAAEA